MSPASRRIDKEAAETLHRDVRPELHHFPFFLPLTRSEHHSIGGKVFHHVLGSSQQPTDRNTTQLRSQRLQHHDDSWL